MRCLHQELDMQMKDKYPENFAGREMSEEQQHKLSKEIAQLETK